MTAAVPSLLRSCPAQCLTQAAFALGVRYAAQSQNQVPSSETKPARRSTAAVCLRAA